MEGKGEDKGKGVVGKMWRGRGRIKGRGCREDVEGKGDDKGKGV